MIEIELSKKIEPVFLNIYKPYVLDIKVKMGEMNILKNAVWLSFVVKELAVKFIAFLSILLDVKHIAWTHLDYQQAGEFREDPCVLLFVAAPVHFCHNHYFYLGKLSLHQLFVAFVAVVYHRWECIQPVAFDLLLKLVFIAEI